jgi:hypothetical protein
MQKNREITRRDFPVNVDAQMQYEHARDGLKSAA